MSARRLPRESSRESSQSPEARSNSGVAHRPRIRRVSGGSLADWFQCILVVAVTSSVFTVFYFPSLREKIGRDLNPGQKWWQSGIIYRIYHRSFMDSDGDGIGDIRGIISKLDYFDYLGVKILWLSPLYKSPMFDHGYDVEDFKTIDPISGTMEDFTDLVESAHARGLKIIIDFIPNHTSNKHYWFEESRKSKSNHYSDYYVWVDGITHNNGSICPPNNWVSVFGGSAWQWEDSRHQFYLHQFTKDQPDLNFRNVKVCKEMVDLLMFWLQKGVDGFRVDTVRHIYEIEDFTQNEPRSYKAGTTQDEYEYYEHPHTVNLPETHDIITSWRELFDTYGRQTGKDIFMVVDVLDVFQHVLPYYHSGANFPINFILQYLNNTCDGFCFKSLVDAWLSNMPEGKWSNWVLGSHDVTRIADKMGSEYVNALNMALLLLPGTPTTYYGEELGMNGIELEYKDTKDPFGLAMGPERYKEFSWDPQRSPMQWTSEDHAGFTKGPTTWLPVHPNYKAVNVESQMNDPAVNTPLKLYRKLAQLRRDISFQQGGFDYTIVNKNIFSFVRYYDDYPNYLVAINIGKESSTDNYRDRLGTFPQKGSLHPNRGWVVHNTGNVQSKALQEREVLYFDDEITLNPGEGVVIRFWTKFLDGR